MDARTLRPAALVGGFLLCLSTPAATEGAEARTTNFVVLAPTPALAQEIGQSAEQWRRELAIAWLGKEMPAWSKPCPIQASVAPHLGAGGETSFVFDRGEVFGWTMKIQGSRERILDSVLPHEITHTIFACHFRQPLPRWADEGACTTVEHRSEVGKQERMLIRFLETGKGIPFSRMFALKEYPQDVLPLYSQGHSVTTFLIERRGKQEFLRFLAAGMENEQWEAAVREYYGHDSLYELQDKWLDWVKRGRPRLALEPDVAAIASNEPRRDDRVALASSTRPVPPAPASSRGESVYATRRGAAPQPKPAMPANRESVYDSSRDSGTYLR